MRKYKVAIIGCGMRSGFHIDAYGDIKNAEVTACCAPTAQRRSSLAVKYGLHEYSDPEEMLLIEKPDIVHIITWPDARIKLMQLVSDLHVPACIVEKPIAFEVKDWKALCNLQLKTKFSVCHQFRWHPYFIECQQAVQTGKIGKLRFIELSARMNLSGQGTHLLNYGMALNDNIPVKEVSGISIGKIKVEDPHKAPESNICHILFENNVRAVLKTGSIAPACGAKKKIDWQHLRISGFGSEGYVLWEELGLWKIKSPVYSIDGSYRNLRNWRKLNNLAQSHFQKAVIDWLEDDKKVPGTSLKQSLHEWKVILAILESSLRHDTIQIQQYLPSEDLFQKLNKIWASYEKT
jgi:predicted dehydrogenase